MPDFRNYDTISPAYREQILALDEIWKKHLGGAFVGLYIHGSLCLGCFQEGVSDIDALILTARKLTTEERAAITADVLKLDGKPAPLEMSAICISDLTPWKHPVLCQFHYSDYWKERCRDYLEGRSDYAFVITHEFDDPDLTSYIRLLRQCGICVEGQPVEQIFPHISDEDFWAAISCDTEDYDFHAYNPRYFASNILILGRILSFKRERRILSKYDGGLWTIDHVPDRFRGIVADALRVWYDGGVMPEYDESELTALRDYLVSEIQN
ncbi:MAG: DUF4111 domain-containing protein [Ruminococcaceae bacterium]|nr:DUF4111 domain-containing protein [Oscillospiraceae bacterium]